MRPSLLTAALAGAALALAGCGGAAQTFPSDPHRLVTGDPLSADLMTSLGLPPAATLAGEGSGWAALLGRDGGRIERLAGLPATGTAVDALSASRPDAIVATDAYRTRGFGGRLRALAPTVYVSPTAGWRAALRALARRLGREQRAAAVIAALDDRVAALRPQVAGRTIAVIRIAAPTSFTAANDFVPTSEAYERDLGLRNFHFREHQYPYGCGAAPKPPKPCRTNGLYVGLVAFMGSVDALLVETGWTKTASVARFMSDEQLRKLPAVKERRIVEAGSFGELGPLGVSFLYSAIARALGIRELHATLGAGRRLSVALAAASGRLCWAIRPAAHARFVLDAGARVRLGDRARGCATLPERVIAALTSGTRDAVATLGSATADLRQGPAPVAVDP
jgi:ABC-type Fe3+-hydroxamate transport system substrate-binding protein